MATTCEGPLGEGVAPGEYFVPAERQEWGDDSYVTLPGYRVLVEAEPEADYAYLDVAHTATWQEAAEIADAINAIRARYARCEGEGQMEQWLDSIRPEGEGPWNAPRETDDPYYDFDDEDIHPT
jgi:hypothetical protein